MKREFIAYKRTKKSTWHYSEYSDKLDRSIDEIAPDCGNFEKIRLREVDEARELVILKMEKALEWYADADNYCLGIRNKRMCVPDNHEETAQNVLKDWEKLK